MVIVNEIAHFKNCTANSCAVLEVGYFIDYNHKPIQDPLSASLSLTDEELQDERVMKSINEMLEEYVW